MRRLGILVLTSILLLAAAIPGFAATTVKYYYPDHDFWWISHEANHASQVWTDSTDCSKEYWETQATEKTKSTTSNSPEMPDMPDGYNIRRYACDGSVAWSDGILYQYEDLATWQSHGHSYVGGVTYHFQAPSSWCSLVGATYPCGDHPVKIHINLDKWSGKTDQWKIHLLMHETGHATGLDDYCGQPSIMNNGATTCQNGNWSGEYYRSWDQAGVYNAYH